MRVYINGKDYGNDVKGDVKIKIYGTTYTLSESHDHRLKINKNSIDDISDIRIYPYAGYEIEID